MNPVIRALEAATGIRSSARPRGMIGTPSGRCRQSRCSLHRPVTAERAIRAGSIADVPCICNNGRAGTIDGRQSFLPVGAPAVNSGVPRGRGHSLSGAVAASRSCSACSAAWALAAARVRAARSSSPAADRPPGSSGMLRPSVGNRLTAVRWPPAALSGVFSTSACTWATVMLSRASTSRHRLNPRRVGSGRYWTVRARAPRGSGARPQSEPVSEIRR